MGNPGRKSSYGKRSRSLEYITDTNLEKTSVSADELPGSLRNLFLPSSPREGYRPGLKTRRLSPFRPACGGWFVLFLQGEGIVAATTFFRLQRDSCLYRDYTDTSKLTSALNSVENPEFNGEATLYAFSKTGALQVRNAQAAEPLQVSQPRSGRDNTLLRT